MDTIIEDGKILVVTDLNSTRILSSTSRPHTKGDLNGPECAKWPSTLKLTHRIDLDGCSLNLS